MYWVMLWIIVFVLGGALCIGLYYGLLYLFWEVLRVLVF